MKLPNFKKNSKNVELSIKLSKKTRIIFLTYIHKNTIILQKSWPKFCEISVNQLLFKASLALVQALNLRNHHFFESPYIWTLLTINIMKIHPIAEKLCIPLDFCTECEGLEKNYSMFRNFFSVKENKIPKKDKTHLETHNYRILTLHSISMSQNIFPSYTSKFIFDFSQ